MPWWARSRLWDPYIGRVHVHFSFNFHLHTMYVSSLGFDAITNENSENAPYTSVHAFWHRYALDTYFEWLGELGRFLHRCLWRPNGRQWFDICQQQPSTSELPSPAHSMKTRVSHRKFRSERRPIAEVLQKYVAVQNVKRTTVHARQRLSWTGTSSCTRYAIILSKNCFRKRYAFQNNALVPALPKFAIAEKTRCCMPSCPTYRMCCVLEICVVNRKLAVLNLLLLCELRILFGVTDK